MKRWIAQSLFTAAVGTCGICASTWANAQPGAQSQEGCCPESTQWRPGDTPQGHSGDDQHVNFLWPAL